MTQNVKSDKGVQPVAQLEKGPGSRGAFVRVPYVDADCIAIDK